MNDLIYMVDTAYTKMYFLKREEALDYYYENNGTRLSSKTKDLFPEVNIILDGAGFDPYNLDEGDTMKKTTNAERKAIRKYDEAMTTQVKLKLNLGTDKDIIDYLSNCSNKQGLIKELIRERIQREQIEA